MSRRGIIVGGVALTDRIMKLQSFPGEGSLVDIGETTFAPGGALCNVLLDLSVLDASIPLRGIGIVGTDAMGELTYKALTGAKGADLTGIRRAGAGSYTDVYESEKSHQRTFFHQRGANALLDVDAFDFRNCTEKIFYIGYIMLLDTLDSEDPQYGTRMARLLHNAREAGLLTCVDVVSLQSGRFRAVATPSLRYTDLCVINETEAQNITGIPLRGGGGKLLEHNMEPALHRLMEGGVSTWAIIHAPEASFGLERGGSMIRQQSPRLPDGFIQGTVGAGDAFCAGVLCIAHQGGGLAQAMRAATAAACASLRRLGATEGLMPLADVLRLLEQLGP